MTGSAAVTFETVIRLFEAGDLNGAAETCNALLQQTPGDLSARNMLGVIAAQRGVFAAAAEHFEICAASASDDPAVARNLAQAYLETGDGDRALDWFRRTAALSGKSSAGFTLFENADSADGRDGAGAPATKHLTDVIIETSYWGIFAGNRMNFRDTANLTPANSPVIGGRINRDNSLAVADIPDSVMEIDTPCVFLGGDENYAHWLLRYLMRLALIEDSEDLRRLPLLTIDTLSPYQRDSLAMLGYDDGNLIKVPRNVAIRCSDIHLPACLRTDLPALGIGLRWLRKKFLTPEIIGGAAPARRIFVSRRDAPSRHMTNEDEVLDALAPFGVEAVELGRLSFAEQVALFAQAELVIGPHGAGLVNIAFSPDSCPLIELVSDPIAHMNDFRLMCDVLSHPLTVIPSRSHQIDPGAVKPAAQHSFETDPATIAAAVRAALGG